jgi:hypothetical protein
MHPCIPELRSLKQEDLKFKTSLGYIVKTASKKKKKKEQIKKSLS